MGMVVEVKWNFECKNCPKYVKSDKERTAGFCPIKDKKVAKTFTCRENPLHTRFWFYMIGISLESIAHMSDECLEGIMEKAKLKVSEK